MNYFRKKNIPVADCLTTFCGLVVLDINTIDILVVFWLLVAFLWWCFGRKALILLVFCVACRKIAIFSGGKLCDILTLPGCCIVF